MRAGVTFPRALAGIAAVLPAYRSAKALWFALFYLYDFTEDAPRSRA